MNDIYNNFDNLSLEEKIETFEKIKHLYDDIKKYFEINVYTCGHCAKKFYVGEAEEKFETWVKTRCKNPYSGYLDKYEYEDIEQSGFRYYCPHCKELLYNQDYYIAKLYYKKKESDKV